MEKEEKDIGGILMGWMFRLSLLNMKRRRARTVLTILGVTIGVISIVSLLALGLGVKKELLSQFEVEKTRFTALRIIRKKASLLLIKHLKNLNRLTRLHMFILSMRFLCRSQ